MSKSNSRKFIRKKPPHKPNRNEKYIFLGNTQTKDKKNKINNKTVQKENKWPLYLYVFAVCFVCGIILMGMLLVEKTIAQKYDQLQADKTTRASIEQQIVEWKGILQKYPDYRDGYYHLAVLEYELGNKPAAQIYNQQALDIDPNYTPSRQLEKKL